VAAINGIGATDDRNRPCDGQSLSGRITAPNLSDLDRTLAPNLFARLVAPFRTAIGEVWRSFVGYDVFLSYSSDDVAFATAAYRALHGAGFRVFFDRAHSQAGLPLLKLLAAAARSRMVLVVLTPSAGGSAWVAQEIEAHLQCPGVSRVCAVFADPALIRTPPESLATLRDRVGIRVESQDMASGTTPSNFTGEVGRAFRAVRQFIIRATTAAVVLVGALGWYAVDHSDWNQIRQLRGIVAQDRSVVSCSDESRRYLIALAFAGFPSEAARLAQTVRDPERVVTCAAGAQADVALALLLSGETSAADNVLTAAFQSYLASYRHLRSNMELAWSLGRRGRVRDLDILKNESSNAGGGIPMGLAIAGDMKAAAREVNATEPANNWQLEALTRTVTALAFVRGAEDALDFLSRVESKLEAPGLVALIESLSGSTPPSPHLDTALQRLSKSDPQLAQRLRLIETLARVRPDDARNQLTTLAQAIDENTARVEADPIDLGPLPSIPGVDLAAVYRGMDRDSINEDHDRAYVHLVRAAQTLGEHDRAYGFVSKLRTPAMAQEVYVSFCHIGTDRDATSLPNGTPRAASLQAERFLRCGRPKDAAKVLQSVSPDGNWRDSNYASHAKLLAQAGLLEQAKSALSHAVGLGQFQRNDDSRRPIADVASVPVSVAAEGQIDEAVELAKSLPESNLRAAALIGILRMALDNDISAAPLVEILEAADQEGYAAPEPGRAAYVVRRVHALARLGRLREARLEIATLPDAGARLGGVVGVMEEYAKRRNPHGVRRFVAERALVNVAGAVTIH